MDVRIAILGPLLVTHRQRELRIPPGQPAKVLVELLLHAGQVVSIDHLMSALWEDESPPSARKAVQVHVSQLRRVLADVPGVTLTGSRQGYRVDIPEGSLDLHRFRELVASGDFGPALALWRGPALQDLADTSRGLRLAAALEEERLAAVETHAEARLNAGEHHALVGPLTAELAAHPLRERLRGALMLALHRSGRQPDALAVYAEGRRLLADELGLDPSPTLQSLHASILQTPASSPLSPRELPVQPPSFVGRTAEITELLAALEQHGTVAVHGPGGQGKSAVVLHVAHRVADRFPDGQLYADLQGASPGLAPLQPAEVVRRFLRALGTPPLAVPTDAAEATALYRSVLAPRKVLVVLDNAVDAAQVVPLLPGTPSCAVLITSRRILATVDGRHLALGPLPEAEAVELLETLSGQRGGAEVARSCDHLPLALRIAAARLRSRPDWTMDTLARRLADQRHRLDELHFDDLAVRSSLQLSVEGLPADAVRAFALLSRLHVPSVSAEVAVALLDAPERVLDPLVDARLVEATEGRYRMHDLIRLLGTEIPVDASEAALQRAMAYYRDTLAAVHASLRPHAFGALSTVSHTNTVDSPLRWITEEADNLLAAARAVADTEGLAQYALTIAHMLYPHLYKQDRTADLVELGRIAGVAAQRCGAMETALLVQSAANRLIGEFTLAREQLRQVLEMRADDPFGRGRALTGIGTIHRELGELDEALACLTEAVSLVVEHGPDGAERVALSALAQVHQLAGRYADALECAQESLALARKHDDPAGAAYALASVGQAQLKLGDPDAARVALDECVELCRITGEHNDLWQALLCRSEVVGEPADAEECLALTSARGDRYGEGAAHRQLAKLLGDEQHASRAAELLGTPGLRRDNLLESVLSDQPR
ncbi:SARP family transcriptional regulator [Lentzea sp. NBRC 105346]|uniref:AfsR/SARP family transcriptional regulator n=1 Tax=Lentzea sp. NBRC 105346 TaxID=3032205 RepID=UPI00249FF834|nr:BTAD domain-containing putative transcriptional regulator [Lentzea sp. NBRC 105346]GLZ30025.1 SARP family transcriptional regulator [Lentzea sp. NBRC 105346]